MRLENEFTVSAPLERTWSTLLDIERVATCLPGAAVERGGDDGIYRGTMRMKLGPMNMSYKGTARLLDVDEDARVATMEARAREAKGAGTASATIQSRLTPDGDGTTVRVTTDLTVTGRQAQFGRGIMQDVAERMLGEFAERLEREIASGPAAAERTPEPRTAAPAAEPAAPAAAEPLDLGGMVSGPLVQRVLPVAAGAALLAAIAALITRRPRRGITIRLDL